MSSALSGHQRLDRRSLALHQAIAAKLRAHPELLAIARENLDRWSATPDGPSAMGMPGAKF